MQGFVTPSNDTLLFEDIDVLVRFVRDSIHELQNGQLPRCEPMRHFPVVEPVCVPFCSVDPEPNLSAER